MFGRAVQYSRSKLLNKVLQGHGLTKVQPAAALLWNMHNSIRGFAKRRSIHDETIVFEDKEEPYVREEITSVDRLFRFHPLKEEDEGDDTYEDEFEGRPDNRKDEDEFLEDGDIDPRHKLGKALLSLGKVHYRHAEKLPEWFLERQDEICQYRTNPQIRRCLKDWMVKHDRDLLEKYRSKTLQWGHKLSTKDKPNEIRAYGPEETIAYSFYYMPGRYGLLHRVFGELSKISPDFAPRRILDFGCGPATAAAAAHEIWGSKAEKYTGVDISQSMIDAAKIMTRNTIRDCAFYTSNSEIMKRMLNTGERFDLVVASYTLSELPNDPSKRIATQMLFETLDVGGYMVILEPGNPYGSHNTRTARQFVLDTFNNVTKAGKTTKTAAKSTFFKTKEIVDGENDDPRFEDGGINEEEGERGLGRESHYLHKKDFVDKQRLKQAAQDEGYQEVTMMLPPPKTGDYTYDELGAYVVAPCTHDKPCPLKAHMWCSFSQKVYSGIIRTSSEEKFSYVIIQKRPKTSAPGALDRLKRTLSAVEAATAAAASRHSHSAAAKPGNKGDDEKVINEVYQNTASTRTQWAEEVAKYSRGSTHRGDELKWGTWAEPIVPVIHAPTAAGADKMTPVVATPLEILERFMGADEREVPKLVDRLVDEIDWEEYKPPLHREEWGRIIRSPLKNKKHVTMDVCTPNGYVQRSTVSKSNMHHIPSLYTAMRKTTWGGLYPVLAEEDNRNAVSKFAKGTRLRSEADDVSVYPEDRATTVEPKYRGDGSRSARDSRDSGDRAERGFDKRRGGQGSKEHDRRREEREEPSMHTNMRRGSSPVENNRRESSREEQWDSRAAQQGGSSSASSPSRGGASKSGAEGKVRREEITASAGSAQYRKLQMIQAFGREEGQKKETKSFGGANSVTSGGSGAGGGAGGSAGGADAAPKSGLAGQLERMKRRREEKARAAQQGYSSS